MGEIDYRGMLVSSYSPLQVSLTVREIVQNCQILFVGNKITNLRTIIILTTKVIT
jgi:hypothetical protein